VMAGLSAPRFFTEISFAAMILSVACLVTESNHKIHILAN
jgi:hypothetical protein